MLGRLRTNEDFQKCRSKHDGTLERAELKVSTWSVIAVHSAPAASADLGSTRENTVLLSNALAWHYRLQLGDTNRQANFTFYTESLKRISSSSGWNESKKEISNLDPERARDVEQRLCWLFIATNRRNQRQSVSPRKFRQRNRHKPRLPRKGIRRWRNLHGFAKQNYPSYKKRSE